MFEINQRKLFEELEGNERDNDVVSDAESRTME